MTCYYDLVRYPTSDTIKIVTYLLERITKTNDKLQYSSRQSPYSCFYARSIPTIDIQSYLARILKYCPCANECFISLLIYLDRMSRNLTGLRIDSYNIHRLIITGIMVASKFFSDMYYTNARYAKVGGLPVTELNALELQFLKLNNFKLNIQIEELQQYGNRLLMHWNNRIKSIIYLKKVDFYKKEDYQPIICYTTTAGHRLNHSQTNTKKIQSCSSSNLFIMHSTDTADKLESITNC
ncbi:cyclin-domain-containing protein [Cokeromyces recurvatus]|uniref:cyclin-domain-containing protein n=1 Tax=Cokeromyces recurvatus TaxID=90255 RepID=UPI002220FCB0|nr:cyclin-domain-containing protein [Cokeromyces recurvatus]KAI7907752.1 cyclin-domain-containing protein [Cokeromyces recurvatus]